MIGPVVFFLLGWWACKYVEDHAPLGVTRIPQLPGDAGIYQTIALMRSYVNQNTDHPLIRKQAIEAVGAVGPSDHAAKVRALFAYVQSHMRYVPDPLGREQLTTPDKIAEGIARGERMPGDCDDMSMYGATLAKAVGLRPFFKAVGRRKKLHHVYVVVDGIVLDPTVPVGTPPFPAGRKLSLVV